MDTALNGVPEADATAFSEGKGFGIRTLAYVLDSVILYGVSQVIGIVAGVILGAVLIALTGDVPDVSQLSGLSAVDFITGLFNFTLYFTLFEWMLGASPGKLLTGLRVVSEDGTPCNLRGAFLRALLRFVDGLFFGIIAYASMKKTPLNQRLGDRSGKTVVVSAKDPGIREKRPFGWFFVAAGVYAIVSGTLVLIVVGAMMV